MLQLKGTRLHLTSTMFSVLILIEIQQVKELSMKHQLFYDDGLCQPRINNFTS